MTTLLAVPTDDFFLGIGILLVALFVSERIWNAKYEESLRRRIRPRKRFYAPSDPERLRKD